MSETVSEDSHPEERASLRSTLDYEQVARDLQAKTKQLELITKIQSRFIREPETRGAFDSLLSSALAMTSSAYGFIGEILYGDQEEPYLRTYAITDIAWNPETKRLYHEQMSSGGMEFRNLSTLFGHCIRTGDHVIANDPANDPRSGKGLPPGHAPLETFLGVPIKRGDRMIGMMGLANRPGGYSQSDIQVLEPMVATFATLIDARRANELRNQYETEIMLLNQTLEKQVEAMDANVDGLAILEKGRYTYMNPAHAHMYGYEVEQLIGQSWEILYTEEKAAEMGLQVFPVLESQGNWRGELIGNKSDGSPVDVLISLTALPDDQLICSCCDISQRKKMEVALEDRTETLRLVNQDLKAALKSKDEFTASMSHELRTPLNAILNYAELLDTGVGGLLSPTHSKYVGKLTKSAEHLLSLINDILDLSHANARAESLQTKAVSMRKLCESALDLVRQDAHRKSINLTLEEKTSLANLIADERRMRQVLVNLLSNAIKFTPDSGTVKLSVGLEWKPNPVAIFTVIDSGIGIAEHDYRQIFEPFFQLDQGLDRQFEGTGLGLTLVKKLVEMHGGEVDVKSKVGNGTEFKVRIPWTGEIPEEAPLSETTSENRDSQQQTAKKLDRCEGIKILLVEDNQVNRDTIESYLTAQGAKLTCAQDGIEAIEAFKNGTYDVILMDIQMPRMDGFVAMQRIRALEEPPQHTPIIALTALALAGDAEKCMNAGADEYLSKPFKLSLLTEFILKYSSPTVEP